MADNGTWHGMIPGSGLVFPPSAGWVIDQKMLSKLKQPDITELQSQIESMRKDLQEIKELLKKQSNEK